MRFLGLALLTLFVGCDSHPRYSLHVVMPEFGLTYMLDQKTGDVWIVAEGKMRLMRKQAKKLNPAVETVINEEFELAQKRFEDELQIRERARKALEKSKTDHGRD